MDYLSNESVAEGTLGKLRSKEGEVTVSPGKAINGEKFWSNTYGEPAVIVSIKITVTEVQLQDENGK